MTKSSIKDWDYEEHLSPRGRAAEALVAAAALPYRAGRDRYREHRHSGGTGAA
jgi:hypothetical protein